VAEYLGGPLDGQKARGRRSVWRDETGNVVETAEGDRRYLGQNGGITEHFYVLDGTRYIHSTVWKGRPRG
jgi:hypothetical protein